MDRIITVVKNLSIFLTILLLISGVLLATSWGLWIMFIGWALDAEFDRLLIIGTSLFWSGTGAITWAILRTRKS